MAPCIVYRWQDRDGYGPFNRKIPREKAVRLSLYKMRTPWADGIASPKGHPGPHLHGMTAEQLEAWRSTLADLRTFRRYGFRLHRLMVAWGVHGGSQVVFPHGAVIADQPLRIRLEGA